MPRAASTAPAPPVRRTRAPVLVIEDTPSLQMIYRAILSGAACDCEIVASAAEGLAAFQRLRPKVVLLDLAVPEDGGLDLLETFLRLAPDTRVIVITANGSINRAVEAMRAGAHDFLVKPVDEQRLIGAVENAHGRVPRPAPLPPAAAAGSAPAGTANANPGTLSVGAASAASAGPAATAGSMTAGHSMAGSFLGGSAVMARVHSTIASAARSMATVFITGESGTGKELCAGAVHDGSPRASGPFIALNCGAIPQDLLESEVFGHVKGSFTGAVADKPGAATAADGGTLFLDEVCEMAPALQTKLLRFLQTSTVQPVGATRPRKVNVRIVCATNRDPLDAVRRGQFREDLYYRLYVVPIHMPPLRDRGSDVIEIAEAALIRFAAEEGRQFDGLTPEVRELFLRHGWPGNVRQLLNVIRNVVVLNDGGTVTPAMLPQSFTLGDFEHPATLAPPYPGERATPDALRLDDLAGLTLAEIERRVIEDAIERHGGSVPKAARVLDVSPSTLYRKISGWQQNG